MKNVSVPYSSQKQLVREIDVSDGYNTISIVLWKHLASTDLVEGQLVKITKLKISSQSEYSIKAHSSWLSMLEVNSYIINIIGVIVISYVLII